MYVYICFFPPLFYICRKTNAKPVSDYVIHYSNDLITPYQIFMVM